MKAHKKTLFLTQSSAFYNLFLGLWICSFIKAHFTTTLVQSMPYPKKMLSHITPIIKTKVSNNKEYVWQPLNRPSHPSLHTNVVWQPLNCPSHPSLHTNGVLFWFHKMTTIPMHQKTMLHEHVHCHLKHKSVFPYDFFVILPSPIVWSIWKVMWIKIVTWNECQCMD